MNLDPELIERLIEFVREFHRTLAADEFNGDTPDYYYGVAGDLLAKLPPPVDPDIEEARKLAAETCLEQCNSIGAQLCLDGEWDREPLVKTALKSLKRGRSLERGE